MISFVNNTHVASVCCKKLVPQLAERHVFLLLIDFVLHKHVSVIICVILLTVISYQFCPQNDNLKVKIKYKNTWFCRIEL